MVTQRKRIQNKPPSPARLQTNIRNFDPGASKRSDNKNTPERPPNKNLFEPLTFEAENSKMSTDDEHKNSSQDTSIVDNSSGGQLMDPSKATESRSLTQDGKDGSQDQLELSAMPDDAALVSDPLNLQHYQDNFPPLKLSTEAKAVSEAAKAKNAMRREQLLKIAEENSRKTIEEQVRNNPPQEQEAESSSNAMEVELQKAAASSHDSCICRKGRRSHMKIPQANIKESSPSINIAKNPYTKSILRRSPSSASASSPTSNPQQSTNIHSRPNYKQKLDKPIILKRGIVRAHVHRYDIRMSIEKYKSEDDEQQAIQKALQAFLEILLQADPKTVIPPYFELERGNKDIPDLSTSFQVSAIESFSTLKRYVTCLNPRYDKGNFYGSLIIAQTKPFHQIIEQASNSLQNQGFGIWPKSCNHELCTDIGWFLYSLRQQDDQRLTELISELIQEPIRLKWKQIRTTTGYVKRDPNDESEKAKALHIEGPADRAHEIRAKLSKYYGASAKTFPDGAKMRFIPPFTTIISSNNKLKHPMLVARQLAINQRIGYGTTSEIVSYLALDKKTPSTGNTLRQVLMNIPSSTHEGVPVFHSIDRQWRSESIITFTFLPDNESDGRMFIGGLIPFLRAGFYNSFQKKQNTITGIICGILQRNRFSPPTKQILIHSYAMMMLRIYWMSQRR
jgi:hypothetical protein